MKKKQVLSLMLVLAMLFGLTACGSGDGGSASSGAPSTESSSVSNDNLGDLVDTKTSSMRESLVVAGNDSPGDPSPWAGANSGVVGLIYMVYESLFIMEHGQELEPCLAKDYTVNGSEITVNLFDNIYDSAGNHFTASDVVFSLDKAIEGGIISYTKILKDYRAEDDTTVVLDVGDYDALTVGDLETFFTNVYMVTQAAYEASSDGMFSQPIGTGRYAVTNFTADNSITFELRDDYWQTDEQYIASRSVANVKTIRYDYVADSAQRAIAVETGAADVAMGVSYTDVNAVNAADGVQIYAYQQSLTRILLPNCSESSVCSDVNVRKAIFYALNNEALAATYTDGTAVAVYDMANSNYTDYYEDYYKGLANDGSIYGYNLEQAKQCLADAGYGEGEITLTILTDSSNASTDLATAIGSYLQQAGFKFTIEPYQNNLITEFAEDETNWDLYLRQSASNSYATVSWARPFAAQYYKTGGTCNFIFDDYLQEQLTLVTTEVGHTEESVKNLYQYIIDNAYGYGLICAESYLAVPTDTVFVSMNASLMPSFSSWVFE